MELEEEIKTSLRDVRSAFRLLAVYQQHVLGIVRFIAEQTHYRTIRYGRKRFSRPIVKTKDKDPQYDSRLKIVDDMWGWDFLYGYVFEYYLGSRKIGGKNVKMSIIQVSDDGCYMSHGVSENPMHVPEFTDVEESHSYLILLAGTELWPAAVEKKHWEELNRFLGDRNLDLDYKGYDDFFVIRKYEMEKFSSEEGTMTVLKEFAEDVKNAGDIDIFSIS